MVKTKKLNESAFAKLMKEIHAVGEEIRTHQDEKQAVLNDFDKEMNRYKAGRISEKAVFSSSKKTNKELEVLDKDLGKNIDKVKKLADKLKDVIARQKPNRIRVKAPKAPGAKKHKKAAKKKK